MSAWRPPRGGRPFSRPALEQWLASPRGRELLTLEQRELGRVLAEIFGRHVLQIGSWGRGNELLGGAETLHQAVLGTIGDFGAAALTETERLPIAAKTVDAVVLPHTLEFTHSPHNLLREANRILTDRGRLFVMGFNPWGMWGLRQRLGLRYRAFPTGARFYSVGRLCDWLELGGPPGGRRLLTHRGAPLRCRVPLERAAFRRRTLERGEPDAPVRGNLPAQRTQARTADEFRRPRATGTGATAGGRRGAGRATRRRAAVAR